MNPDSRLLHLPQSSRYAVTAMFHLASRTDGGFHMVGEIAKHEKLSPSYLAKILQRLALKGLLDSRRGSKGGYRLSRPVGAITISEIVTASRRMGSGPMPCMIEARDCDCAKPCAMHEFVAESEGAMWLRLNGATLANVEYPPHEKGRTP